jgi:glucosamine--fructose-6-phosphate aminotransferase (isomerizing)
MCGIVGAVAQRDVAEILLAGLQSLEYRGYDSAGMAIIDDQCDLQRLRRVGKVSVLGEALNESPLFGGTGMAHTRWATHGEPSEINAHPHISNDEIVLVHNGIIENHQALRVQLQTQGYIFTSQTDSEVIAHLVHSHRQNTRSLLDAVQLATKSLVGAYGAVIMEKSDPDRLIVARSGSPLVIGCGVGEHFVASDQLALLNVTRRFIFLEEGDVAEVTRRAVSIFDVNGQSVVREIQEATAKQNSVEKGDYRHYMQKEMFEQPNVVQDTLQDRLSSNGITLGLDNIDWTVVDHIQIVACGTSYNAASVARYWFERFAGIACDVEIASEFRYRHAVKRQNSVFLTLSQSGETADTLAALRLAKAQGYCHTLSICNVAGSSLVRESAFSVLTQAGTEIGVASTKAFTTQLATLLMMVQLVGTQKKTMSSSCATELLNALHDLPIHLTQILSLDREIETLAAQFVDKHHALFLGRGEFYPIAMEAALKLKEISYIHAEAYAAGELKHGPLALIDSDMPVIVIAPSNDLLEKLNSNIEEVRARGGQLFVFADKQANLISQEGMQVIELPHVAEAIAPIVYTLPMQLLSYHVALIKGTDVDQPRNLAKAVTVE